MLSFGRGGVHPPEMKLTSGKPIIDLPLPRKVIVSLCQSLGKPAREIVKTGDHVAIYQLIGEAQGVISANVHTPISGTVKSIGPAIGTDGRSYRAITIEATDEDHFSDLQNIADATPAISITEALSLSPKEIIDRIHGAGIVGLGGATFPTDPKLTPPPGSAKCEYLLINGAECEPYLTCDEAIMREKAPDIINGIRLLRKALNNPIVIIGIEDNKPQAIKAMSLAIQTCDCSKEIQLTPMRTRYPQGGEKMLIKTLTGREIASGALPISQGAIIHNVATALAVYHAVVWNIPLVERVMTISGADFDPRGNYRVSIGTPIPQILDHIGAMPETTVKIINGGTMMGRAMAGIMGYTTKGMSGLLMLNASESPTHDPEPCIRCGSCVEACPMGLEPYLLARASELGNKEMIKAHHILDCMECGCCSYSCIAHRHLVDWIKVGKQLART